MFHRWGVVVLLSVAPACADVPEPCAELPTCGATGVGRIASPTSATDERYNRVLQLLQNDLHRAAGRYIDGTLPAYEGTATFVEESSYSEGSEQYSDGSPFRRDTTSGHAVALLEETQENLAPGGLFPLTTLHLHATGNELDTFIGQDHREPGVPVRGPIGSEWTCTGSSTAFVEAPDRIVLDDIVCEQQDYPVNRRLELEADLRRMAPSTIDYADLLLLRAVDVSGFTPELGGEDRCLPAVVQKHEGPRTIHSEATCYVEAHYQALSFVRTDCVTTHGVAELEVGEARRCCCSVEHCHPNEYECQPL
jgi:hypothetical protein